MVCRSISSSFSLVIFHLQGLPSFSTLKYLPHVSQLSGLKNLSVNDRGVVNPNVEKVSMSLVSPVFKFWRKSSSVLCAIEFCSACCSVLISYLLCVIILARLLSLALRFFTQASVFVFSNRQGVFLEWLPGSLNAPGIAFRRQRRAMVSRLNPVSSWSHR